MVRRVIVDMATAHILLDTPYPVHQARRDRLDPDAPTPCVAGMGVSAHTSRRLLKLALYYEKLGTTTVRHLPRLVRIRDKHDTHNHHSLTVLYRIPLPNQPTHTQPRR